MAQRNCCRTSYPVFLVIQQPITQCCSCRSAVSEAECISGLATHKFVFVIKKRKEQTGALFITDREDCLRCGRTDDWFGVLQRRHDCARCRNQPERAESHYGVA